jgi:integrase
VIKKENGKDTWMCSYGVRHPISRKPMSFRRVGLSSKRHAERTYRELVLLAEKKIQKQLIPNWPDQLGIFLDDYRREPVQAKTVDNYRQCLQKWTLPDWQEKPITEISSDDIRELFRGPLGNKSVSHRKSLYKMLRAVFNNALEKRLISHSPMPKMKFTIPSTESGVLNGHQINLLLRRAEELKNPWYPIWATALYTGMRNGELYALTWNDIDWSRRRIKVKHSWNKNDLFKSTKSLDHRQIEIPNKLYSILMDLREKNRNSKFVLPRLTKWTKGEQARELRSFLIQLGLPRIKFHDLRASWATYILSKGVPPASVMVQGGWKDLKTVMIYLRKSGIEIENTLKDIDYDIYTANPIDRTNIRLMEFS